MTGAAMPIDVYDGNTPTMNVEMPISRIVIRNVYLRPTRSPRRPKTMAPNGRTAKPAENASSAKRNCDVSFRPLKNCLPMIAASDPYR